MLGDGLDRSLVGYLQNGAIGIQFHVFASALINGHVMFAAQIIGNECRVGMPDYAIQFPDDFSNGSGRAAKICPSPLFPFAVDSPIESEN